MSPKPSDRPPGAFVFSAQPCVTVPGLQQGNPWKACEPRPGGVSELLAYPDQAQVLQGPLAAAVGLHARAVRLLTP